MILAFDFDRTLFDTDADIAAIHTLGAAHLIGDPQVHTIVDPASFLYADTVTFLHAFDRQRLYVVSAVTDRYGPLAKAYQQDKIARTGVESLVREVILTGESKVMALSSLVARHPGEQVVFIDDKTDVILEILHSVPTVLCVHMVRAGARRMSDVTLPDDVPVIHTLRECAAVLARYG